MFHSLYFRLLAAFTLIILIIVGTAFVFAYRATHRELSQVEQQLQAVQDRRVESELGRLFQFARSWDAIQPFVEQMGNLYGRHIVITNVEGDVVVDSAGKTLGEPYSGGGKAVALKEIVTEGPGLFSAETVGTLYIDSETTSNINRAALEIAYNGIGRFFIIGGLLAVLAALLLTGILSRVVLAPVRALKNAARKFGKGDFSHRVAVDNSSEIGELAMSFNTMADDLEKNEKARRNMVADIAHELRTPLSNLRGYLEAISDGLVEPDAATIRSLSEETETLSRLVEDLQELSLADAGVLKLVMDESDIGEIVDEAVAGLQAQAVERGVGLVAELQDGLPLVELDRHRIRQVLNNLVSNALAHTPSGGKITVSALARPGYAELSVKDTGEGIPEADLPHIFERFYRVDKSRARSTGGSGLGLTIAKRLVEAHGGTIYASSVPGEGSTLTFCIPFNKDNNKF